MTEKDDFEITSLISYIARYTVFAITVGCRTNPCSHTVNLKGDIRLLLVRILLNSAVMQFAVT